MPYKKIHEKCLMIHLGAGVANFWYTIYTFVSLTHLHIATLIVPFISLTVGPVTHIEFRCRLGDKIVQHFWREVVF